MTLQEAEPIENQQPIVERLEAAKSVGLISDYLLRWRGTAASLSPKVTVWSGYPAQADTILHEVAARLAGLVGHGQIVVIEDEREAS